VGICTAFRAQRVNIGGEGQIAMGGLSERRDALAFRICPVSS